MDINSYYTDHWREIEADRFARYLEMFQWRDGQRQLLAGADIGTGMRVLDIGSGPGFFAEALADMVGATGQVDGVDINPRFVEEANRRTAEQANLAFHLLADHRLPFPDGTFDRVIMKNVLEYVPSLPETLSEVFRVTQAGGKAHVIDSDWGFVVVEPWGKAAVDEFFLAAAPAFNEPHIGRKAAAALRAAGFARPDVALSTYVDREGFGLNVLTNMASYIRTFETLPEARVASLLEAAKDAVAMGDFLFCLPQFLITATRAP